MMDSKFETVAITGVSGYLGNLLRDRLADDGFRIIHLGRKPSGGEFRFYSLEGSPSPDLLEGVDTLIHCAYDMNVRRESDIWRINVDGTGRLLDCALSAGVRRTIVLSSMSAFNGTRQLYGQSKLQIENHARGIGAISVRPGIVYGPTAGGMAGALSTITRLPVVPVVAARSYQFTLHEDDFAAAIVALVRSNRESVDPIGLANPSPVPFREFIRGLARYRRGTCPTISINWRLVLAALRAVESLGIDLPFRADSLLGLANPAPFVPNLQIWDTLGIHLRRFGQPVPSSRY
jgi:nucleoside-diphosphate-sugar epimerase